MHDFSPIFKVLLLVHRIRSFDFWCSLNSRLDYSWVRIKERNNFIVAVVFLDEFLDFGVNAWNFSHVENGRSFVFVFVKYSFYYELDVRIRSFWKDIDWCINDLVKKVLDIVTVERLLEGCEFIHDDTHCPNVSFCVIWSVLTYLRWHEIWRTTFGFCHVFFIS